MRVLLYILPIIIFVISTFAADDSSVPLFLLTYTQNQYKIEQVSISEGETLTYTTKEQPELIDIILPVGPGGSGAVAQKGLIDKISISYKDESLQKTALLPGGKVSASPPIKLSELHTLSSHLCVTGNDGSSAAFVIDKYQSAHIDSVGPVLDMFRGMVPLNSGDYSLFINTEITTVKHQVKGEIPVDYSGKYLFTKAIGPNGKEGLYAVDIGASVNLMEKACLPTDAAIAEKYMIEYSQSGKRHLKYSPGGATGPVETVDGTATLQEFSIGELHYNNVAFDIMSDLPDLDGCDIDGIIGLDLLKGGRFLTLKFNHKNPSRSKIIMSDTPPSKKPDFSIPFVSIRKLMYTKALVNNRPVSFILDSGSPDCMLIPNSTTATGLKLSNVEEVTYKGGGGQVAEGKVTAIQSLTVGGKNFKDIPCVVGELFALSMLGKGQHGGLLGNSFFSQFSSITIDFEKKEVGFKTN